MHVYFYIRGIKQQTDMWITLAQGQFWKWERKNLKTKKIVESVVQGALRPSILGAWEYIFPEECLAEVLTYLGVADSGIGAIPSVKNKAKIVLLRKLFQCKKIPKEIYEEAKKIQDSIVVRGYWRALSCIKIPGVAVHVIGYKKDARQEVKKWGYEQEML